MPRIKISSNLIRKLPNIDDWGELLLFWLLWTVWHSFVFVFINIILLHAIPHHPAQLWSLYQQHFKTIISKRLISWTSYALISSSKQSVTKYISKRSKITFFTIQDHQRQTQLCYLEGDLSLSYSNTRDCNTTGSTYCVVRL